MEHILDIVMIPIQVIIVFYSLYYFTLACFGLMKRREHSTAAPKHTFAAVICAHNEERVIWQLIDNLKQLNYPRICTTSTSLPTTVRIIRRIFAGITALSSKFGPIRKKSGRDTPWTGCFLKCWPKKSSMMPSSSLMPTIWSIRNFCGK